MGEYTTVSARLDAGLKSDAERVLAALGLTHSAAISALYSQIVLQNGMPFDLKIPLEKTSVECTPGVYAVRSAVRKAAEDYGVSKVWLFGSRARGEAQRGSDVDLLVEKGDIRGLELGGFADDLERSLGTPVDIVTTTSLPARLEESINEDRILIYER